jgi:hypothetical protein
MKKRRVHRGDSVRATTRGERVVITWGLYLLISGRAFFYEMISRIISPGSPPGSRRSDTAPHTGRAGTARGPRAPRSALCTSARATPARRRRPAPRRAGGAARRERAPGSAAAPRGPARARRARGACLITLLGPRIGYVFGPRALLHNECAQNHFCTYANKSTNIWKSKKVTLNNRVMGNGEMDAYDVFRDLGIIAPRHLVSARLSLRTSCFTVRGTPRDDSRNTTDATDSQLVASR